MFALASMPLPHEMAQGSFDIAAEIEALSGYDIDQIDGLFAAEQRADIVLIPYDVTIPVVVEPRQGYLLIRIESSGQWVRVLVPTLDEWTNSWLPGR